MQDVIFDALLVTPIGRVGFASALVELSLHEIANRVILRQTAQFRHSRCPCTRRLTVGSFLEQIEPSLLLAFLDAQRGKFLLELPLFLFLYFLVTEVCLQLALLLFVDALLLTEEQSRDHSDLLNVTSTLKVAQHLHQDAFAKGMSTPDF